MDLKRTLWTPGKQAAAVGILVAALLLLTSANTGLTRDEPASIAASESYAAWFTRLILGPHGVLNRSVIDSKWSADSSNPPFDKELSGLVWLAARSLLNDLTAHRLANILLAGLSVALLYLLVCEELGGTAGIVAAVALVLMPRFLFQAHLAVAEVPAASMMVIVVYVFWRTKESARFRNTLGLGIVCGLAFATRIDAAIILPGLLLWALFFRRKIYLLVRLALAGLIGVALFVGVWPWLYYDTLERLSALAGLSAGTPSLQFFLQQNTLRLPWFYPFVVTMAVVPLGTAIFFIFGFLRGAFRRRDRSFCGLLAIQAFLPLALLALPLNRTVNNDSLIAPALPFLAALAGAGFSWLVKLLQMLFQRARVPAASTAVAGAAAVLFLAFPLSRIVIYSPHTLSYYSEAVGGLPGADRLGLETTYWGESYREAINFINAQAKAGDSVWVEPDSYDILAYYQLHGVLRGDVRIAVVPGSNPTSVFGAEASLEEAPASFDQATFVLVQYHQSFLFDSESQPGELMLWIEGRTPAYRVQREGIPILEVYTNP